jgi:hypothetical protein
MHTGIITNYKTQERNRLRSERPQPQPPHTGETLHRRLQPLCTQKYKNFVFLPSFINIFLYNINFPYFIYP